MSLAYKLWKIGSVLEKDNIKKSIKNESKLPDPNFFNIDFTIKDESIVNIQTSEDSIANENKKFFFTKKMGGAGTGIFYLYPNLKLQKSVLSAKISLLINTVSLFTMKFSDENNAKTCNAITHYLKDFDKHISKVKFEIMGESLKSSEKKKINNFTNWNQKLLNLAEEILKKEKGDYLFWFSINGKTFYELMPEVWNNWFENPAIASDEAKEGYDFFSNEFVEVGYRPEIKIFSYDNYHDSLNARVVDNLSLSMKSARNIKFAWMYILDNLVFSYNSLEYILLPNMMKDDKETLKTIIKRLGQATLKAKNKKNSLKTVVKKENKIKGDIKKIEQKLQKNKAEKIKRQLAELEKQHSKIEAEKAELDKGMLREFDSNINEIGDLKHTITVDFLFTEINRTNSSFSIKSSIEDVIPSRLNKIVKVMNNSECLIDDNVKLGKRDRAKVYLQDYFNRDELLFIINRSARNNKGRILKEQIYLARLLLTDATIKMNDLLKRFEFNREYNYEHKKRMTKEGVKEWIEYSTQFSKDEQKLISFLQQLNKIQE